MFGFFCTIYCLKMITPSAAAMLRTSQIIVAVLFQGIIQPDSLESLQTIGGVLILIATMSVIFDYQIEKLLSSSCSCASSRNQDDRFTQVGISGNSSWLDSPFQDIMRDINFATDETSRTNSATVGNNIQPARQRTLRRVTSFSIAIS